MNANVTILQRNDEDKWGAVGASVICSLLEIEANDLQICNQIVLVDAVFNDIPVVSVVGIPE